MEVLGKRLYELRKEKGWSLRYIAHQVGINYKTYDDYEKNISNPKPEMIVKLAELYGTTPNYLLGVDDVP